MMRGRWTCLLFVLLLLGSFYLPSVSAQADPPPSFAWAMVKSENSADGLWLIFDAKVLNFNPLTSGDLTVTWPDVTTTTTLTHGHLTYSRANGSFYSEEVPMPPIPPVGTFTFEISTSAGSDQSNVDFTCVHVPIVDTGSMDPADLTYTGTTEPTFSWNPVSITGKTTYYCVEVFDWREWVLVYRSNQFTSTSSPVSFTIPPDTLRPDTSYKWCVQASDGDSGLTEKNCSGSACLGFYTGSPASPSFGWTSARTCNSASGLLLQFDADFKGVLPTDVNSCTVSAPNNGINQAFDNSELYSDPYGPYYWHSQPATILEDDTFSFNLETTQGSVFHSRPFTFSPVPVVNIESITVDGDSLGNYAYLDNTTSTFSWDPIILTGKSPYYRVQIQDWNGHVTVYQSARSPENSLSVPSDILLLDSSYRLRIRPTDGGNTEEESNESRSAWYYFTLAAGGTPGNISGHVYQIDGQTPIGGATIEALGKSGGTHNAQTTTASNGSYTLNLYPGDYALRVSAPGYAREYYDNVTPSHEATIVQVDEGSTSTIDFDLTEGGSISGHIYESDGVTPVAGATVFVRPSLYFFDDGFWAMTNPDGSYVIDGLALGQYKVTAQAAGYAVHRYYDGVYGWNNATNVAVTPPDTTSDIDIRLHAAGSISGHVYASDGVTPIRVGIIADPQMGIFEGIGTFSNPDGSYTISGLPPYSYTVRIGEGLPGWYAGEFYDSKQTYGTADLVAVSAGQEIHHIDFTLEEGGAITGSVIDAETGGPISGVQLSVCLQNGDITTPAPVSSHDGSYRINLRPGTYLVRTLHAHAYIPEWYQDAYQMADATPIPVEFHLETSGIDLYLERPGSISGAIYEEDGVTPIAGANIFAFPVDDRLIGNGANSQPDGTYIIEGLASGTYVVHVTVTGHVSASQEVVVDAPNETPDINFSLAHYPYTIWIIGQGIVGSSGGSVSVTDPSSELANAGVDVPEGALSSNTVITIGEVADAPPFPGGIIGIGASVHFGPEGLNFTIPVTIKIPYTQEDLDNAGVTDPNDLDVYIFDTNTMTWEPVAGPKTVNAVNNLIMVEVTHFSIFRLGAESSVLLCKGDFNGDQDVDGSDVAVFAGAFGSSSGGLNYNPAADFNGDGDVDQDDLVLFAGDFGRTNCP